MYQTLCMAVLLIMLIKNVHVTVLYNVSDTVYGRIADNAD